MTQPKVCTCDNPDACRRKTTSYDGPCQLDQREAVVIPSRQSGKTAAQLKAAKDRVRKVGHGATINGTYRQLPDSALEAFRADLLLIVGETE